MEEALQAADERQRAAVPYFPEYANRPLDLIRDELFVQLEDWATGDPNGAVGHHEASRYTIEALWRYRYVHERGPRKFSKTYKNADLVLAFFLMWPCVILLLGPTYSQVHDQQMGGIRDRLRKANARRKELGLAPIEPHITERRISFSETHYIKAISADKSDAVQGYHSGLAKIPDDLDRDPTPSELEQIEQAVRDAETSGHRILVVEDEAIGVRRGLFDALEGTLQGPISYNLMSMNPTEDAESDHPAVLAGKPGSRYHTIALSHLSTDLYPDPYEVDRRFDRGFGAQWEADQGLIPQEWVGQMGLSAWLQDREWVASMEKAWAPGTTNEPLFKAYVLGQWASTSQSQKVIPLDLILATQDNVPDVPEGPHIGVDLAGSGGDRCVALLLVDGYPRALDVWTYPKGTQNITGQSAKRILGLMAKWGKGLGKDDHWTGKPISADRVHIDDTGLVGVSDWLVEHGHRVDAVDFAANDREDWKDLLRHHGAFANMRARMHFIVQELLQQGLLAIPDEPEWAELRQEMQWPSWAWSEAGGETRRKILPKVKIKEEYGRSPDILDALLLACCRKPRSRPVFGSL